LNGAYTTKEQFFRMKNILLTLFVAISINSFAQDWTDYQVDSVLTLKLPDNYEINDTLGIKVISAAIENAMITVSMLQNTGENAWDVKDEKELLAGYQSFKKGYIKSNHGQLIKDEIIETGGLKMIRFSFHAETEGEKQVRHCITVIVNKKMYAISFIEVESLSGEMAKTREILFSSMKFSPGLGLNNQLNTKGADEKAYNQGLLLGKITVGLVIALVVWSSIRRKKKKANAQPTRTY
jgi:hypothetical protein